MSETPAATRWRERMTAKVKDLQAKSQDVIILALESSCDETAIAITRGREVLASAIASQIDLHARYGGVVPEIASRHHLEAIDPLIDEALAMAGMDLHQIDAIAVAYGPGLVGALLTAVTAAKALAFALDIPLLAVHHIHGHICANYIANPTLSPPFLALVVSGGHTHLVEVPSYGQYKILGRTRDDAAGEAFDKAARAMGLPYPGGPNLEKAAREGSSVIALTRPQVRDATLDFSFSGLKTQVINKVHQWQQNGQEIPVADLAASFQKAVIDSLVERTLEAAHQTGHQTVVLAGGVAANSALREALETALQRDGREFICPPMALCTDNAVMIAAAGLDELMAGRIAGLDLNAQPSLSVERG